MILSKKCNIGYINKITNYLDNYLEKKYKDSDFYNTYIYDEPINHLWAIRIPGVTVGHIKVKENIITDIILYEDSFCYKKEVLDNLNQFVGKKLDLSIL